MNTALQIVDVPIHELIPAEYNPRSWSEYEIARLDESLDRFGPVEPEVVNSHPNRQNVIIGGHFRVSRWAAKGHTTYPCVFVRVNLKRERELNIRLNKNTGSFDPGLLRDHFTPYDLVDFGFTVPELVDLSFDLPADLLPPPPPDKDTTTIPAVPKVPVSMPGDVWVLGRHRLMCGDSTVRADVEQLIPADTRAPLLHADPPYGMGKQNDGVENDNLYQAKLDRFQMAWWKLWRTFLADNASAYVWGTSEDLWRLWYSGGLKDSERMTFRNEIVWDKQTGMGMNSDGHRQFATATERCLFFMLGEQGFGNVNKDDYWEGFEPIRSYLEAQAKLTELSPAEVHRVCGVQMYGHWFSKSQWTMIPAKHYAALKDWAQGKGFLKPYAELRALYDGSTSTGGHLAAKQEFYGTRAWFDNVHDNMRDVWNFERVQGEDRHGHATPKPVALTERCIRSSCPPDNVVLEPFRGSGSTLIAAEHSGRTCYTMELTPGHVDVAVMRWQAFTGQKATHEGTDLTFDQVAKARDPK